MRTLIAAVVLLVLPLAPCHADQASKDAKIARLMAASGLTEVLERQMEAGQKQAAQIGPRMLADMKKQLPELDDSTFKEFNEASERFIASVKPTWTMQEAATMYGRFYGENVSEQELDGILAFYESPLGQKDIAASHAGVEKWNAYYREKGDAVLKQAVESYTQELKAIVQRARSRRQQARTDARPPATGNP